MRGLIGERERERSRQILSRVLWVQFCLGWGIVHCCAVQVRPNSSMFFYGATPAHTYIVVVLQGQLATTVGPLRAFPTPFSSVAPSVAHNVCRAAARQMPAVLKSCHNWAAHDVVLMCFPSPQQTLTPPRDAAIWNF